MLGPLTVGKKAAKFGYRRFGKPGAVVFGAGSVGGYYLVKRKLKSKATQGRREDAASEQADGHDESVESDDPSRQAE
ncbi:hypothetical protein [Haladaptatus salinisoli]|uniref:hypothetical protein n=1 Tax=Haladaptatus salinisoli TaxID=2884876 RepID=UPI001D0A9A72|nr:hypothetical protein [Haladaptatus salinisoli]